jgi:hypothetical protein
MWALVAASAAVTALTSAQLGFGASQVRTKLAANLTAAQEVPRPRALVTKAHGRFTAIVSGRGRRLALRWSLRWSDTSGRVLQAHVHLGRRGVAGRIAVGLCGPCGKTRRAGSAGGLVYIRASVLRALRSGNAYVNLHTKKNPGGEIRGQIKLVRR